MSYQPKTGQTCGCKPGIQRDNCPSCEGTGRRIDFCAIRERDALREQTKPLRSVIESRRNHPYPADGKEISPTV